MLLSLFGKLPGKPMLMPQQQLGTVLAPTLMKEACLTLISERTTPSTLPTLLILPPSSVLFSNTLKTKCANITLKMMPLLAIVASFMMLMVFAI